jgi:hypothetical protein
LQLVLKLCDVTDKLQVFKYNKGDKTLRWKCMFLSAAIAKAVAYNNKTITLMY